MDSTQPQLRRFAPVLLIIILAAAAALRFYNLRWDDGIFAHPDERSTVAFYAPTIAWPEDPANLLDPRASRLNPFWNVDRQERRSYTYGHFPLYTLTLVADGLNELGRLALSLPIELPTSWLQFMATAQSTHNYALIGRALVALADLFSVYLLFLLGRRLYGVWGGLLAAAFSAFTVLQIQLAHFFAVDPLSTTFTLLAIYGALLLYERQSIGAAVTCGLGIALAVASKFSALPVVFAPLLAGYLAARRAGQDHGADVASRRSRLLGLVILTLTLAFIVFAVTSPFVLLDFENFRRAVLDEQGNMVSGVADFPFTRQYRNTTAYWYFIEQQLRWGMGWALGLLGLAGTAWVALKAIRGKVQVGELLGLLWLILYFGPTGLFLAKFMRYMVPVVPFFSLFGAGLVVALWRWQAGRQAKAAPARSSPLNAAWANGELAAVETNLGQTAPASPPVAGVTGRLNRLTKGVALTLATVALGSSLLWAVAFVNGVYGSEHTWVTFARWVYANVPDGSCIAYEHWDDRMPTDIPEPGGNPGAHNYVQPQLPMYDPDTQQKYELIRDTLRDCEYVVLASNRLWRTIPGLPERYPLSSRYYQALFSGELGFEPGYSVETPPRLGPFVFDDQAADESFTVYDHPQPILFKKERQLSMAEWDAVLGGTWQEAIPGYVGPPTLLMRLRGAGDLFSPTQTAPGSEERVALLDRPVDQLPVLEDYRWNDLANNSPLVATLLWWGVMMLIGLLALPLTFWLFHKLPNRGYSLSKSVGLLLLAYLVWISGSLIGTGWLGNTLPTIVLMLLLLAAVALLLAVRQRRALAQFWQEERWFILLTEVVFSAVYLLFIYLRVLNPDLWHPWLGGEKMLEIGFLNAIVKSAQMPPYDPFFAGGTINYYYYGLFLVGVLIKLTGIQPGVAFNLAIPTLAALTAISAFGLAANLVAAQAQTERAQRFLAPKIIASGLLAVIFILFMGNLEGALQFLRNLAEVSRSGFDSAIPGLAMIFQAIGGLSRVLAGAPLVAYNYWDPTRVIPQTINEFPFFSFLFADLHPHMIGIPFTLLFLSLAFNWLLPAPAEKQPVNPNHAANQPDRPKSDPHSSFFLPHSSRLVPTLLRWLALPFALGALAVINTWDLPTYLGLMVAAFLLAGYRRLPSQARTPLGLGLLAGRGVLFAGALLGVTYLLYAPFFLTYQTLDVGLGLVHTQTPLDQHLKIWGFFLLIIVTWLLVSLRHPGSRHSLLRVISLFWRRWNVWPHLAQIYRAVVKREGDFYQLGLWSLALVLFLSAGLFLLGYRVPAYLLPLTTMALLLLFRAQVSAATAYLGLLVFTGLLVLLGVEFFFLRDFLGGGDYYRMNTLFKFFIQVWVMFGIVAAVALPQLWNWSWRWPWGRQFIWRGGVMLLLLAGLVYPIFGARTRVDDRFPGADNRPPLGTLDGLAYMKVGTFEWPAGNPIELKYDYEAIRWLQENVEGTPIIAEAKVGYYREGGMRVAAYTGLPSVLGGLHQNEQRPGLQISSRDFLVNELWFTQDPNRARQLIDQLEISYIYVGQVERATYGQNVGDKFDQLVAQGVLEIVFENAQTKIYKVRGETT